MTSLVEVEVAMPREIIVSDAVWEQIKTEYLTSDVSIRGLSMKYGVPYAKIQRKCNAEEWVSQRLIQRDSLIQKVETVKDAYSDNISQVMRIGNKMLKRIEELMDEGEMSPTDMRQCALTLRDLKEIKLYTAAIDKREQEARIAKLEKEASQEANDATITIVMDEEEKGLAD